MTAGVFFEYLPKRTICSSGIKTVWIRSGGKDKERVTLMLLGDSDGNKYPVFLVFKAVRSRKKGGDLANWTERRGFGIHVWTEAKQIMNDSNSELQLYANPTAWWTAAIHLDFLKRAFAERSPREPVILLVDDFSGHWTEEVQAYARSIDVHLMKVPPSCTSVCQPADIAWNRPFKCALRSAWVGLLRDQLKAHKGKDTAFKMTPPNRLQICDWVQRAWLGLSKEIIKSGFQRAHILQPVPPATAEPLPEQDIAIVEEARTVEVSEDEVSSDDDLAIED